MSGPAPPRRRPPRLRAGDTVGIAAPAKPLDPEVLDRCVRRLEDLGYGVRVAPNATQRRGYLAGGDADRAAGLMGLQKDPSVRAILCGAGGYGCTRILPLLDYHAFAAHPKIVAGFSDVTALHLALGAKAGTITFHAPMPTGFFGWKEEPPPETAVRAFWAALAPETDAAWGYTSPSDDLAASWRVLRPGVAQGPLVGGNLSLVCALTGTPYQVRAEGAVLFLEDVGEEPYRVDRMLSHLRLAGTLDDAAGIVLGTWSRCEPETPERSLDITEVLEDYFADFPGPVVLGFPAGHQELNLTLPLGCDTILETDPPALRFPRAAAAPG